MNTNNSGRGGRKKVSKKVRKKGRREGREEGQGGRGGKAMVGEKERGKQAAWASCWNSQAERK